MLLIISLSVGWTNISEGLQAEDIYDINAGSSNNNNDWNCYNSVFGKKFKFF